MKKIITIIIAVNLLLLPVIAGTLHAYWVWTPETKKFINPKYAVKDTPKEQYDWAMDFYDQKDYKRAAIEFEKLVKNYEYSEYAAKAQYYAGLSYEDQSKYYIAFQNYQKAVDNFPHIDNIDEIIAREFNIGNIYASKQNPKVLGTDIMTSYDRAIEVYKKVVDNAPFGRMADQAQFKMAQTMKDAGRYDEATIAFQKILDDYPASPLYDKAKYEMANSAYKASLQPAYDQAPTDKALKAFEEFTAGTTDQKLTAEAQETIKRLKNKAAEKSFNTAEFYEQIKRYESAIVYYKDVIDRWPDSASAEVAKVRIEDLKIGNYGHKKGFVPSTSKAGFPWFGQGQKPASVPKVTAPKVVAPVEKAPKKGWSLFDFGKKATKVAKAAEPAHAPAVQQAQPIEAAPVNPDKQGWWVRGLGKKSTWKKPLPRQTAVIPVGHNEDTASQSTPIADPAAPIL